MLLELLTEVISIGVYSWEALLNEWLEHLAHWVLWVSNEVVEEGDHAAVSDGNFVPCDVFRSLSLKDCGYDVKQSPSESRPLLECFLESLYLIIIFHLLIQKGSCPCVK